jgi:HEAT repeat protein
MFLRGEDAPRVIEEALASGRELGVSAGAIENPAPDLIFEHSDLARQVRLADAEALGGAREMRFLGEDREIPILPQFERPVGA